MLISLNPVLLDFTPHFVVKYDMSSSLAGIRDTGGLKGGGGKGELARQLTNTARGAQAKAAAGGGPQSDDEDSMGFPLIGSAGQMIGHLGLAGGSSILSLGLAFGFVRATKPPAAAQQKLQQAAQQARADATPDTAGKIGPETGQQATKTGPNTNAPAPSAAA